MMSALLDWFILIYGPFWQGKMHRTLDFFTDYPGRNQMYKKESARCPNIYTVTLGSGNDNDNGNEILFLFTAAD